MSGLPEGRYLSAFGRVRSHSGGKTIAMLARNRSLTTRFGVATSILTFDPSPDYDEVRGDLADRGALVPGMELLNVYEAYRGASTDPLPAAADRGGPLPGELADLGHHAALDVPHPDGTVHCTEYRDRDGDAVAARDYRRPDGSVFARVRGPAGRTTPAVVLADHAGRPVRSWRSVRGWHRHWLHRLAAGAPRVFVFTDAAPALEQLGPLTDPRFVSVHVLHEVHLRTASATPELRDAPLLPELAAVFEHLERLDAMTVLTEQQCTDLRTRFGDERTRFVVVPNDVAQLPAGTSPTTRAPATFVMMARLTGAKAIDRAVEAIALVARRHPAVRLEVYGEGPRRDDLARLVTSLGLDDHVALRGYDPAAKDRLREATGFVSTATKETFGLAILEAMARGCPVVAYDVPYGPPALVDDGVDGYLVADGDTAALAERICSLIESPDDVRRLSAAAVLKAERFEPGRVAEAWRELLVELASQRD